MISNNSNSLDTNYLILVHIPVRGYGYKTLPHMNQNNFFDKNEIKLITDRMSTKVREEFRIDGSDHSGFDMSISDNSVIEVFSSRLYSSLIDESRRNGIVFGVYYKKYVDTVNTKTINLLLRQTEKFLDNMPEYHKHILEAAAVSSHADILVEKYLEHILANFKTISGSALGERDLALGEEAPNRDYSQVSQLNELLKDDKKFDKFISNKVQYEIEKYVGSNDKLVLTRILKSVFGRKK